MAATGFAVMQGDEYESSDEYYERSEFFDRVHKELSSMTKKELIDWIFQISNESPDILSDFEEY